MNLNLNHQNVVKPYLGNGNGNGNGNDSLAKYASSVNSTDQTSWYITNGYGQYIALSEDKANDRILLSKDAKSQIGSDSEIIHENTVKNTIKNIVNESKINQFGMYKTNRIFQIYLGSLTVVGLLVIFRMMQSQR